MLEAPATPATPAVVVAPSVSTPVKPSTWAEVLAILAKGFEVAAPFETLLPAKVDAIIADFAKIVTDAAAF